MYQPSHCWFDTVCRYTMEKVKDETEFVWRQQCTKWFGSIMKSPSLHIPPSLLGYIILLIKRVRNPGPVHKVFSKFGHKLILGKWYKFNFVSYNSLLEMFYSEKNTEHLKLIDFEQAATYKYARTHCCGGHISSTLERRVLTVKFHHSLLFLSPTVLSTYM